MSELTLESLAARVALLEQRLDAPKNVIPPLRDWRSVIGICEESDFSRQMQAEIEAASDAEYKAAQEGTEG